MLVAKIIPHHLDFIKPAGTSRGVMNIKKSWILSVFDPERDIYGLGEFSIIESLSPDWDEDYEKLIHDIASRIESIDDFPALIIEYNEKPSIVFALETAFADLRNGGVRKIFDTKFFKGKERIPINGLIWMNNKETMLSSIREKLEMGFDCIKLKIGAIDYKDELELLKFIRSKFSKEEIEIRVDANGAFDFETAKGVLDDLNQLDIHSIEQPIKSNQLKEMAWLCKNGSTPIALDEELISNDFRKKEIIKNILPQYIILKPSLHGGFSGSKEWIELAEKNGAKWWLTSALESNIGLNAIAQFASDLQTKMPQGLGTGSLYHNNIDSPLTVFNGHIFYNTNKDWNIPSTFF